MTHAPNVSPELAQAAQSARTEADMRAKFCKDCRFLIARDQWPQWPQCAHRVASCVDDVTGERRQLYCATMRIHRCADGALFEPKIAEAVE